MVRKRGNPGNNIPENISFTPSLEEQDYEKLRNSSSQHSKNNKSHKKRKQREYKHYKKNNLPKIIITNVSDEDEREKGRERPSLNGSPKTINESTIFSATFNKTNENEQISNESTTNDNLDKNPNNNSPNNDKKFKPKKFMRFLKKKIF